METVYRYALKTHKPGNIGIYGCSAGGTLVAQSMAWFQKKKLPLPGAIGIFCSGAMETFWFGGDSGQLSALLNAAPVIGPKRPANAPRDYFEGIDRNDPLVTPIRACCRPACRQNCLCRKAWVTDTFLYFQARPNR
jgi:acetyl esterase/lipase